MNRRMIVYMVGQMIRLEAVLLLLPLLVSLLYREACGFAFLITILAALAVGCTVTVVCKPHNKIVYAKEGFVIVALSWLLMSVFGALPFVISGEIPGFIDAFFETVSGFTTTGASILTDVEALSHGTLFWRSFTHWIGGMGVIVFIMAVVPSASDRSIHMLRAEVPGPQVGKLMPRIKDTAKVLYLIYIVMTLTEVVFLLCGGMPLFESVVHAFGTAGTGGFGVKADSIAGYSPYLQWCIAIFMLLFGVNFNLYYLMLVRRFRSVLKSEELWCYLGIVLLSVGAVTVNILPLYSGFSEALRAAFFQVSSIVTTTGYATADFNLWPVFSKALLLCLMLIGSCAGSTAGGFKISRVVILFKMIRGQLKRMLHPRSVSAVRFEGKTVDSATAAGISTYLVLYIVCLLSVFLILCIDRYDIETNFSAAAACFNNIGPGLSAVGPAANYAGYSVLSKLVLSVAMLFGRLEIYPLLFVLSPTTWAKK